MNKKRKFFIKSGHNLCHPETCCCWDYKVVEIIETNEWDSYSRSYTKEVDMEGYRGDSLKSLIEKLKREFPDAEIFSYYLI